MAKDVRGDALLFSRYAAALLLRTKEKQNEEPVNLVMAGQAALDAAPTVASSVEATTSAAKVAAALPACPVVRRQKAVRPG